MAISSIRATFVGLSSTSSEPTTVRPWGPNLLHGTMLFALAAEEARLQTVALMSQWNPHPTHPVANTREHWIANNVYQWMPTVDVIYVNPGLFAFVYLLSLPMIVHLGMLLCRLVTV